MNGKKLGIGLILSGIIYGAYQLFGATSKLQFGNLKVTGKRLTLKGLEIDISFPIVNTDKKTALAFDGFDGQLIYGSHKLASINIPTQYILKANSTVTTNVTVLVNYFELGAEVVKIVQSQDFLNAAFITGNIKSEGLKFPIKNKIF